MASTFDILRWLLVNAGRAGWNRIIDITAHPGEAVRDVWDRIVDIATHPGDAVGDVWNRIIDITTHPGEAARDLWEWMKANKVTCLLIGGGIFVIAVPPVIGFSAAGPVAGSIAAGWQAAIGNVAAGSLFATLQSLTMSGALAAFGGMAIRRGISRLLWSYGLGLIFGRLDPSTLDERRLSLIQDMIRILAELNDLTRIFAIHSNEPQIPALIDDLREIASRLEGLTPIRALDNSSPPANSSVLLADPPVPPSEDILAPQIPGEWAECIALACTHCSELNVALTPGLELGQYPAELEIRRLLRQLGFTLRRLSRMPPPDTGLIVL